MSTVFHALLILCSVHSTSCAALTPEGSPYASKAACEARLEEGRKEIIDFDFVEEFATMDQDIRFVCHEAPKDWDPSSNENALLKLYGKPKGESS